MAIAAIEVAAYPSRSNIDDPPYVVVDLDFDTSTAAEAFRGALEQLWQSREAAPSLASRPQVRIVETVEAESY